VVSFAVGVDVVHSFVPDLWHHDMEISACCRAVRPRIILDLLMSHSLAHSIYLGEFAYKCSEVLACSREMRWPASAIVQAVADVNRRGMPPPCNPTWPTHLPPWYSLSRVAY
jgi:hypothetical protein